MNTNEEREVTTTNFLQLFPRVTFRANFAEFLSFIFYEFFDIMSERPRYKFKEALDEVFVDEYSNFYPDVLDS